jgi:hypothetical protein
MYTVLFSDFNNSIDARDIREFMHDKLGKVSSTEDILDCLMTTICTDRPLPEAINDYNNGTETSWFNTLVDFVSLFRLDYIHFSFRRCVFPHDSDCYRCFQKDIKSYNLQMMHNDAAFAKLGLGPLWFEIMANIDPILNGEADQGGEREKPPPKLAVFSGHDTTIMPLLASLGPNVWNDTQWPPYASMMIIEVRVLRSRHVRIAFNKYLTLFLCMLCRFTKLLTGGPIGLFTKPPLLSACFIMERF